MDRDLADAPRAPPLGRAKRIDDAQAATSRFAKRTLPRGSDLDGLRVVIDCANGAAYKVAPWCCGSWAPRSSRRRRAQRLQHQQGCGSTHPAAMREQGVREFAPTSASRSTATPTASSSSTRRAQVIDGDQIMAPDRR
jgi:phosphoglucosamine mutase